MRPERRGEELELTLDEVADRMDLPSDRRLKYEKRRDETAINPKFAKRTRRRHRKRRCEDEDDNETEASDEEGLPAGVVAPADRPPSRPEKVPSATASAVTTPYDTDREEVDKSYEQCDPDTES